MFLLGEQDWHSRSPPYVGPSEPVDASGQPLEVPSTIPPGKPYPENSPEAECIGNATEEAISWRKPGYAIIVLSRMGKLQLTAWAEVKRQDPNFAAEIKKLEDGKLKDGHIFRQWENLQSSDEAIKGKAIADLPNASLREQLMFFEHARITDLELAQQIFDALISKMEFAQYVQVLHASANGETVKLPLKGNGTPTAATDAILQTLPSELAAKIALGDPILMQNLTCLNCATLRNILFGLSPAHIAAMMRQTDATYDTSLLSLATLQPNPQWTADVLAHTSNDGVLNFAQDCQDYDVAAYERFTDVIIQQNPVLGPSLKPSNGAEANAFFDTHGTHHPGLALFFVRASKEDIVSFAKTRAPQDPLRWLAKAFVGGSIDQITRAAEHLRVLMEQKCIPRQNAIKLLRGFRKHRAWPTIKEHLSNDVVAAVEAEG
jgi:hypothetical protein